MEIDKEGVIRQSKGTEKVQQTIAADSQSGEESPSSIGQDAG